MPSTIVPDGARYADDNMLLKVYNRRLQMADNRFERSRSQRYDYQARYRNEVEEDQITEEGHRVSVASGIGIVDTLYASMTAVDIEFLCSVIGNGTQLQALASTRALNQAWRDTKGQKRAKDAIKDSLLVDIGWVKVYYDYQTDIRLQDVPDEALEAQILSIARDRNIATDEVPDDELQLTEEVETVLRDRVCVEYVPWELIRFDTSARRIEDVRWVCQYTLVPEYEVQANPMWQAFMVERYGAKEAEGLLNSLGGDTSIQVWQDPEMFQSIEPDEFQDDSRVTICEMWDLETGLITVFPKSRTDIVLHQRTNPLMFNVDYEDRNPFKPLVVRHDSSQLEGIGDMRVIMPALEEMDEYRSNLATHLSRTIPKVMGPEEGLTQKGKDALKSPVWGEFVGTTVDARSFVPLTPPPLPQEAYQATEKLQVEMKDATGVSEPMRGVFPSKRATATEVNTVTDRGDLRQSERRSALEFWYSSIARTMLQLMQVYYDQDRMLRYTDELGDEFQWAWNREDIAIEADILVSLTPTENLTRNDRVQRALLIANLALPLPETDRASVLEWIAREAGLRDDEIRAFVKSQDELQIEQQQAQAQALAVAPQQSGGAPAGLAIG